jgi:phenylacetate-CoA ligase
LIQHSLQDVEVLVAPDRHWGDSARTKVSAGLAQRLGNDVRIRIRTVDEIPVEVSGKYRYVVSHVRPQSTEPEMRMLEPARGRAENAAVGR